MLRRLFKTGNSVVVSLPKEILDSLGLAEGKKVSLEPDRDQRRVILTPIEKPSLLPGLDEDFAHQVSEFIQLYRPALEELAK